MGKTYIIEFKTRKQYDCYGNSEVRSIAKTFDENTTLSEVVEWVKEQALKVLKKYVNGFDNDIEPFSSYPIDAVFPDTRIRARVDYLHISNEDIWSIVFCVSSFDRWGENEDSDVCFCDSEEKADTVYGAIKYKG